MEGKEPIKVRLSTVILLIIILILVGGIVYFFIQNNDLQKTKGENTNQIEALQTQIQELENKVTEPSKSETNTIVDTNTNTSQVDNSNTNNTNNTTDKYEEITKKMNLKDKEIFVVTDVERNKGKYTLKGRVYRNYTLTKSEYNDAKNTGKVNINGKKYLVKKSEDGVVLSARDEDISYHITDNNGTYVLLSETQISTCYKATDDYRKIIVDENVRCVNTNYGAGEGEIIKDTTANKYFEDFKRVTNECRSELLPKYNFEFENGKCVKVTIETNIV